MMEKIYLDSNIIVSLLNNEDKTKDIKKSLNILSDIDEVEFVVSLFVFIEAAKVLINTHNKQPKSIASKINKIQEDCSIEGFSFSILPTSNDEDYAFDDFWNDVGQNMNLYNPGWGDAFHCVIMKNNKVKKILSTDGKDDFRIVPGITLLQPKDIISSN